MLADAARSWTDDFAAAVREEYGEAKGVRLARRYADSFPEAYKEDYPARTGAVDLARLEDAGPGHRAGADGDGADRPVEALSLSFYQPMDCGPGEARLKVFRVGPPLSLSNVLPVLSTMGVEVVDERPYELDGLTPDVVRLRLRAALPPPDPVARPRALPGHRRRGVERAQRGRRLQRAGARGRADLAAGHGAARLREVHAPGRHAVRAGLHRGGAAQQRRHHPRAAVAVRDPLRPRPVRRRRRGPGGGGAGDRRQDRQGARGGRQPRPRPHPAVLPDDHAGDAAHELLPAGGGRGGERPGRPEVLHLAEAAARATSPSCPSRDRSSRSSSTPRASRACTCASARWPGAGCGGATAATTSAPRCSGWSRRRWSRTPSSCRSAPRAGSSASSCPTPASGRRGWRRAWPATAPSSPACSTSPTTWSTARTSPPTRVVAHDEEDSYLVVAADKGTATFSDIANGVAKDYGFWLGDAFASGGSVGYDHKAMGITARGAWESVKRHFREMGVDCQNEDFTCVGVGDMSGDVFGNGMLLSEHTRLVAAFDHRDIFLDPDPDPAASYAERKRLFELPRSSWGDYDRDAISEGGGVHSRRAKRIEITEQVRAALALPDDVTSMAPQRADAGDPAGPRRPAVERRHRHLRQGLDRDQRRGGRQGQRRDPGRRAPAALPVGGRGRQPRPDPAGAHRVRPARRRRRGRAHQHRLHRQLRRGGHLRPRGQHQDPARPGGRGR